MEEVAVKLFPKEWERFSGTVLRAQSGLDCRFADGAPVPPVLDLRRRIGLWAKRGLDIVGSACGLLLLLPFLIGIALSVRLTSRGPALFVQERIGRDGRRFRIYKFRSMHMAQCDRSGCVQTARNDPRVTPIGRILRTYNLDELPQLLNVLRGDMSLVGPRPHAVGMLAGGLPYAALVPYYDLRHGMRPGMTGWAQAHGYRGPTADAKTARARIDHDMAYIQNFSLMLDFCVLGKTLVAEVQKRNGF